jgi:gamma-glutamyltranspeptidase / glutathione hydrolase
LSGITGGIGRRGAGAALLGLLAGCTLGPPVARAPALAEIASGQQAKPARDFKRHAVAAAHPLAAEAAVQVLREGGNALDAAIAGALVLGVAEPQSSGIGGGSLLLHWNGQRLRAWDGRETAPAAASESLFLRTDGTPWPLREAQRSGLAVGVPGAVAAWAAAHRAGGKLPWSRLVQPAITLAREGAPIGPRLHRQLSDSGTLREDTRAAALYFGSNGNPKPVGTRVPNPALVAVLQAIAAQGHRALHEGSVAEDIAARVRGHPQRPGVMTAADLAGYQALEREPLCVPWRVHFRVCGFPPPSSGGLAVAQMLKLLEARPLPRGMVGSDHAWHGFAEASRLAFADRERWVADPDFTAAPPGGWMALLDSRYIAERASRIGPDTAPSVEGRLPLPTPTGGTSHLSVVDGEGGAVALTTSIEAQFGAQIVSDGGTGLPGGFLLNNQLTDFALNPRSANGEPHLNRVQAGKRPRSSMSPTLVFDTRSGQPVLVLGSALGPFIIPTVARVVADTLDGGLGLADALARPVVAHFNTGPLLVEAGRFDAATLAALRARGHRVQELPLASGVHALQRVDGAWRAAADPRREGDVRGD